MNRKYFHYGALAILVIAVFFGADIVQAQDGGLLTECAQRGDCNNVNDLLEQAIKITSFLLQIIGTLAFVMFVYGGFTMILSFGNPEKFKQGRSILVAAIVGLIISLSAFLGVQFVLDILGVSSEFRGV